MKDDVNCNLVDDSVFQNYLRKIKKSDLEKPDFLGKGEDDIQRLQLDGRILQRR